MLPYPDVVVRPAVCLLGFRVASALLLLAMLARVAGDVVGSIRCGDTFGTTFILGLVS